MALTNEQYNSIIREYEEIRDYNRFLTEEKRRKIDIALPEIRAYENRVATLSVQQAKCLMDGQNTQADDIADEIALLLVRRSSELQSAGFSDEDLEPVYTCKACKDTGYVVGPDGVRSKCKCFVKRELEILYNQSGIRKLLRTENFSKLRLDHRTGEDRVKLEKVVDYCHEFIDTFDTDYRNMVLCGTVGTGKSYLSCCVAHELLETCHSVIYMSSQQLFEAMAQHQFGGDRNAKSDFITSLYECDLLIIDDLGTELTNNFVISSLFGIINERHLRRNSTIISTNLDLSEIRDRYSERVLSRLTGSYTFYGLTGADVRNDIK